MLNTFDEIKNWYERTTPLRGKKNEGLDIRPIDERRYKHRRIIKVDDNCYAISDGWHFGDPLYPPYDYGSGFKPTPEDTATYSPIVWRRHADGTETVAIRNAGYGSGTVVARHDMLRRYRPRGILLRSGDRTGKHYIECASGTHYMPKATMLPKAVFDARVAKGVKWGRPTLTDQATLVFRREGDVFVLASTAPVETKKAVNKALKAEFRKPIAEFRDWMGVTLPMLHLTYDETRRLGQEFSAAKGDRPMAAFVQDILLDSVHPQRVALASQLLAHAAGWPATGRAYSIDEVRDAINTVTPWLNKYGGFMHDVPK